MLCELLFLSPPLLVLLLLSVDEIDAYETELRSLGFNSYHPLVRKVRVSGCKEGQPPVAARVHTMLEGASASVCVALTVPASFFLVQMAPYKEESDDFISQNVTNPALQFYK